MKKNLEKKETLNCREEHRRVDIVKDYDLELVAYTKLLKGQDKISCAGPKCTDKYYTFQYKHKMDENNIGSFFCGGEAAKSFMRLANIEPIKLFNPLSGESSNDSDEEDTLSDSSKESKNHSSNEDYKKKWNPIAKQLHNAINLLIVCWNVPIYGTLARYKADVIKYKYREPFFERIKFVNNVIGMDKKNRTLTQMLEELRADNPRLKHFSFDLLEKELSVRDIKSNF